MPCLNHQYVSRQRGFTLLELLVVLLIIGIVISMVSLSVGGSETRTLRDEAQRLTSLLDLLSQESVLNGREMGVQVNEDSYRFLINDGENWIVFAEGNEFQPRQLPLGIQLETELEGQISIGESRLEENDSQQIFFMSSGEVSPFSITLTLEGSPVYYRLDGDLMGELTLEGPLES